MYTFRNHAPTFGDDVFAEVRTSATRVGDECVCLERALRAARSVPRTWSDHVASLDWFLTFFGRQCALED